MHAQVGSQPAGLRHSGCCSRCNCEVSRSHSHLACPRLASSWARAASPRHATAVSLKRLRFDPLQTGRYHTACNSAAGLSQPSDPEDGALQDEERESQSTNNDYPATTSTDFAALPENFCIIESRDSVKSFSSMQLSELVKAIAVRRNRIFLLMEEVRRLRIQARLRENENFKLQLDGTEEAFPSVVPFLPPLTEKTIQQYLTFYFGAVTVLIVFGGILAPIAEVKLGLGGTSYQEFIASMNLPQQLAEVDPIVASFVGGAVGVLTTLLVVEANNAKTQEKTRCVYCEGSGYLMCGNCAGSGYVAGEKCAFCSTTGLVMCTACLCTGKRMATEHDPRIDPFV